MTIRALVEALCVPRQGFPFLRRINIIECPSCRVPQAARVDSWTGAWVCKQCDGHGQLVDLYAGLHPKAPLSLIRAAIDLCRLLPHMLPVCWYGMRRMMCDGKPEDRGFPEAEHYGLLARSLHKNLLDSQSRLLTVLGMGYTLEYILNNQIGIWRNGNHGMVWLTRPILEDGYPVGIVFMNPVTCEEHTRLADVTKAGTIREQERTGEQAWMLS